MLINFMSAIIIAVQVSQEDKIASQKNYNEN